jgi:hypothetical protein
MNDVAVAPPAIDDTELLRAGPGASWGAILAGSAVAASAAVLLLTLGAGLGFASISPWSDRGMSAGGLTVAGIIWLIVTQWLSAALGGYIAGRLRQRWLATHAHEVFFRDTAHGLVTWAVAMLIFAAVFSGSVASLIGGGARAATGLAAAGRPTVAMGATGAPSQTGTFDSAVAGPEGAYDLDKLFRSGVPGAPAIIGGLQAGGNDSRNEAMHIAASAVGNGTINDEDRGYLTELVAARTGIGTDEAQKRVDAFIQSMNNAVAKAKASADEARKFAASGALFTALALLIGAFIASVAAALGGHLRDAHL